MLETPLIQNLYPESDLSLSPPTAIPEPSQRPLLSALMLQPPHQAASYTASSRETGASPSPRSMAVLCRIVAVPPHCPRAQGRYTALLHVTSAPLTPPRTLLSSTSGLFAILPTLSPGYPVSAPAVPSAKKALAPVSLC